MTPATDTEVLAVVRASAGRRLIGLAALGGLGVMLIYIALARPPELVWQIFLIVVGLGALWMANAMRRATAGQVELTETELRDSDGTVLAQVADIESMDRGFFAFKPSNGFLLKTRSGAGRVWRPGLWWRMGRRIGIGGMTPGSQTKFMSEILAALVAQRDQPEPQPETEIDANRLK
ncbi:hypothetical protein SAMN04488523_10194 [Sulfitobacter brevis]|uniref:PH domain-containing protein n=1 Tax=Sulfitobacter brevis TaxID=74348 RepID=A0A1I1SMN6_9RHOB|nr:hypothetical protein [Sulfitobacter brevis]SFD47727.1 hypothetical protein SAMN04488523_10194 [Sulfitobacter brevis]